MPDPKLPKRLRRMVARLGIHVSREFCPDWAETAANLMEQAETILAEAANEIERLEGLANPAPVVAL